MSKLSVCIKKNVIGLNNRMQGYSDYLPTVLKNINKYKSSHIKQIEPAEK